MASVQPVKNGFVLVTATTAAFTIYEAISVVLVRPYFSVSQEEEPSGAWKSSPFGSKGETRPPFLDHQPGQRSQYTEEGHSADQTTSSSSSVFRKYPMATGRPKNSYMSQDREDKEHFDTEVHTLVETG